MQQEQLNEVLRLHAKWLNGDADGVRADLRGADLTGADLSRADLSRADLPYFSIVPEEGSFIGFKATTKGVVKLLVTDDAKRLNSIGSRKCRTSKVVVLEGYANATGTHFNGLIYETGVTLEVEDFDDDIRNECSRGIHFFMTRREAENWT